MFKKTINQIKKLIFTPKQLKNFLTPKQTKKQEPYKRTYGVTGAKRWPGFVPVSTMRIWYNRARHANIFRAHQGVKECARRVTQHNAGYCYNKEAELAEAGFNRG